MSNTRISAEVGAAIEYLIGLGEDMAAQWENDADPDCRADADKASSAAAIMTDFLAGM